MANLVNLHALATLDQTAKHVSVISKGFLGDAMFGFGLRPRYWADYASEDEFFVHMQAYRDYDVLTFDLPTHGSLFAAAFREQVRDGVVDDYRGIIGESAQHQLALQRIYIDLTQRVPRMTLNGVLVLRDRTIVRLPFADRDLVDFALALPPGMTLGRQIMLEAFRRTYPDLAQVPVTPSGLPIMECGRDVWLRALRVLHWHMRKRGLGWLAGPTIRPYKDYDGWFRNELGNWIIGILLDKASLERGYFDPHYIRNLVDAHMAGENHAVRIGSLLSIELWHRQFIDG